METPGDLFKTLIYKELSYFVLHVSIQQISSLYFNMTNFFDRLANAFQL